MKKFIVLTIVLVLLNYLLYSGSAYGEDNSYNVILKGHLRIITDDKLRIRTKPDINGEIIGELNTYDFVIVIEEGNKQKIGKYNESWFKIMTIEENEIMGWVYGAWLSTDLSNIDDNMILYDNITKLLKKFNIYNRYEIDTNIGQNKSRDIFYKGNYQLTMKTYKTPNLISMHGNIIFEVTYFDDIENNNHNVAYLFINIEPFLRGKHYIKFITVLKGNSNIDLLPYLMIGSYKIKED